MADRSVVVKLRAEVAGFVAGMETARKSTMDFQGELDGLSKKHKESFSNIVTPMAATGAILAGAFGYALKAAADFDKQMSEVGAVSGATGAQLNVLRQAALGAGRDTQYSATQAAKAEAELAKAGMSTTDILGGGLKGALSLAAAGQIDLADAATITATTLNTFHLNGEAASHTADILAAASNKSAADVQTLAQGMAQAGLVASQAGWSLKDTTAVLAAFADRGLKGSDAGTSLKQMLLSLENPSAKAAATMKELGISAYDSNGHFVTASALAGQLRDKLGGLSEQQRNSALATIFGSDAIRAANILYSQGSDGIKTYAGAVDDYGAAARVAAAKTDNLAGDLERLKGSLETVAIQSGSGANTGLRALTQTADGAVHAFSALPGPVQATVTILAGLSGTALLAGAGFLKARQTGMEMLDALRQMGPVGESAAGGLSKVGRIAGQASIWAVAIFAAYEGIRGFLEFLASDTKPVTRNVDDMTNSLRRFADTGQVTGTLAAAFGKDLHGLDGNIRAIVDAEKNLDQGAKMLEQNKDGLRALGQGMADTGREAAGLNDKMRQAAAQSKENFGAMDQALSNLVKGGGAAQAKIAYDQLAAAWVASGHSLSELTAMLPQYSQTAGDAASATGGLASGFGNATANAYAMSQSWQEAISKGQTLLDLWTQLNGGAVGFAEAEIQVAKAIDDASASFQQNGTTLDINTAAGRANKEAILQTAEAAAKAAQAKYQETGSVDAASAVYGSYIAQLRATLSAAGFTDAQINRLINDYARMPASVTTQVNAPGLWEAIGASESLAARLADLPRRIDINTVMTTTYGGEFHSGLGYSSGQRHGGVVNAAQGLATEAGIYQDGVDAVHFAEKGTGGELFLPLRGISHQRAAALLAVGAQAYGMTVAGSPVAGSAPTMSRAAGGGGTVVFSPQIVVNAGMGTDGRKVGQQIADALRPFIRSQGGDVQQVLGRPGL